MQQAFPLQALPVQQGCPGCPQATPDPELPLEPPLPLLALVPPVAPPLLLPPLGPPSTVAPPPLAPALLPPDEPELEPPPHPISNKATMPKPRTPVFMLPRFIFFMSLPSSLRCVPFRDSTPIHSVKKPWS